jgi:outer membrane biosynthesis protein TonB
MLIDPRVTLLTIMEKRIFLAGIISSFLLHAAVIGFLSLPPAKKKLTGKTFKTIEVTYEKVVLPKQTKKETPVNNIKAVKDPGDEQAPKVKVLAKEDDTLPTFGEHIKDISKLKGKLRSSQKKAPTIATLDVGEKITLPPLSSEKITNPKYLTYNDDMRDTISRNIKRRAYTYVNHPDFQAGEVYLTFVLESNGNLQQVKIIDAKTSANAYLREVALRSIKESNPFPPFPEGFDYPEFTFNLLISFQN